MKKFIPYALSLLCFAIPTKNAWAGDKARLVQIYCQALIQSDTKGRVPHTVDWNELQTRLERRRLEARIDSETMRKCMRDHEDDFESAELILTGKETVRESMRENKPAVQDDTTEVDVSGVTMEVKNTATYAMNEKEIAREAKVRADRYGQMWQRFLVGLKRKTSEQLSVR